LKILVISPWENDWNENVIGTPINYYLLKFLQQENFQVHWAYLGRCDYTNLKNVKFIKIDKNFYEKIDKKYDLIIVFSFELFKEAYKISKEIGAPLINYHFGLLFNPLLKNLKNPFVIIRYNKMLESFKKQADFYIIANDGTNPQILLEMLGLKNYQLKTQPKPNSIIVDPLFKSDKVKAGFIGRLNKRKGSSLLLKIIKKALKIKNLYMIIVSPDIPREFLKFIGSPNMLFIKGLKYTEIYKFYSSIDFLINPTPYGNITLPTVEAFAYSKPVIAFDITLDTIIRHGLNGFLVKPYKIEEFVNYMELLSTNKTLLDELSRNAFLTSLRLPTINQYVSEDIEIFKKFIKSKNDFNFSV
jgi:glycosyltransferase involved in cell wall biosynthesis